MRHKGLDGIELKLMIHPDHGRVVALNHDLDSGTRYFSIAEDAETPLTLKEADLNDLSEIRVEDRRLLRSLNFPEKRRQHNGV